MCELVFDPDPSKESVFADVICFHGHELQVHPQSKMPYIVYDNNAKGAVSKKNQELKILKSKKVFWRLLEML